MELIYSVPGNSGFSGVSRMLSMRVNTCIFLDFSMYSEPAMELNIAWNFGTIAVKTRALPGRFSALGIF